MTTLIISNDEIGDIIKIVESLEDSGLLLKAVTETVQNEVKEQQGGFLSMLLGILGASLLGNLLTVKGIYRVGKGKGAIAKSQGRGINRAGEGIVRARYGNKTDFIPPHPLTNFEIQKYYQMNQDLMEFILELIYLNTVPLK